MKCPRCSHFFAAIFLLPTIVLSQIKTNPDAAISTGVTESRIIASFAADSSFLKVQVKDAQYDGSRGNLPFLVLSKRTNYSDKAKAQIIPRKINPVPDQHASVLRKYYNGVLKNDFELFEVPGISGRENLNLHRLVPFRLTSDGRVEELIDFEVRWSLAENTESTQISSSFKNSSVLSTGDWYKVAITKTGLYKIDRKFLVDLGLDLDNIDPRSIRLYGNGGQMVPELNGAFRYDDLEENAIYLEGESDGVFDESDFLLFYGRGTDEWKRGNASNGLRFEAVKSLYSDSSFYFLTYGSQNGKRVQSIGNTSQTQNASTSSYDYYCFHEENRVNFGKSGRDFFGEYFDILNAYSFSWSDGDMVTGDTLIARLSMVAIHTDTSQYRLSGNGLIGIVTTPSLSVGSYLADYARAAVKTFTSLNNDPSGLKMTVERLTAKSLGYLDKLTVNARRYLRVNAKQFQFRDRRVSGPGKVCLFNLQKVQSTLPRLWNVTDPITPFIQTYQVNGNDLSFIANADSLNEYCLVPDNDLFSPVAVGKVPNQNLHGIQQADYLIITHPLFLNQANRLAAFHAQHDAYTTAVATTDQVYNEFGSGKQDISAIRDFIRMLYSRNFSAGNPVKYVLLMGDGSYNNMTRGILNNTNFIPTYQSRESLSSTSSLATDDFFGLMDANEGANAEGMGFVDVGIGRFTCKSVAEVNAVIAKIENYYRKDPNFNITNQDPLNCSSGSESPMGDWRTSLVFLADDGDAAIHMKGADNLTKTLATITKEYNSDKIYLDAYQRISTPSGQRYPDASEDLVRKIKKGVLLFNYTGHGGEMGLTAERILDIATIQSFDNFSKLPLFITATCEFSRYDDPGRTSAGEMCLTNPRGAAIALMTTCRLAYSSTNDLLNNVVMEKLFKRMSNGKRPALGDVIRMTKSSPLLGGQAYYYANFHLLGDPGLTLSYPEYKVVTSMFNNSPVDTAKVDTLSSLARITIKGFVADTFGNKLSNFNGVVYSTVFDKEQDIQCLLNDPDSYDGTPGNPFKFKLQRNSLFKGKTQVVNGDFNFTFLVPRDISFAYGPGKISYYASNGQTDALGAYDNLMIGGASTNSVSDSEGPQVKLYMNDKNFVSGSVTGEKPVFYADLVDSSGINTLGTSFGHDITAVLNKAGSKPAILNDYYEAALNSYQSGRVRYPFEKLDQGDYQLNFKVWDIQNNSSNASLEFVVAESAELALEHVLNYPNPFTSKTTFFFEHNQACTSLRVGLQVYTITGKQVKAITQTINCEGYKIKGLEWDGRDEFGDKLARGVYVYRLSVTTPDNKRAEKIEKLVILN